MTDVEANRSRSAQDSQRSLGGMLTAALPDLWRWIRRRRGVERLGTESTSDLVQSVCREALEARSHFQDQGDQRFQAWMRTLADRKLTDRARHWGALRRDASRRTELDEESPSLGSERDGPDARLDAREQREGLLRAMQALPPDQLAVLHLQVHEELTTAEIAARLNKSEGAVRILRCRGLARLGGALTSAQDADD